MSHGHPAPTALLLAAHGDGGTDPRDETVRLLAERLAKRLDLPVEWATLKRPETFAEARARLAAALSASSPGGADAPLPGPVAVYPLFMAEGTFVRNRLPARLREAGFDDVVMLPVFGLSVGLVDLIEHRLRSIAAMQGGREPKDMRVLLVGHGSASGDAGPRRAAEALAADLAYRLDTRPHLGFIEETPFVDEALESVKPEIVVGLFVSAGTHALDDLAAAVTKTPGILHHVDAIGRDAGVAEMVEKALSDLRGETVET